MCFLEGFDYKTCGLTKEEIVYYYTISSRYGILLNLLEKFLQEVPCKYRCLPLTRPTKNDPAKASAHYARSQEIFNSLHDISSRALQRQEDSVSPNVEAVRRQGLLNTTKDSQGNFPLWVNSEAHVRRLTGQTARRGQK